MERIQPETEAGRHGGRGGLFDAEVLRQFEAARLLARRAARSRMPAERRGALRGGGIEFSEYRAFVTGDDSRRIDWHAYARWRRLVVRLFVAEQDLHLHFLLDCSDSMGAGSPPKFDHARRVLGGLAYIALGNMDRVGFTPLGGGADAALTPARGRHRFASLVSKLESARARAGRTRLAAEVSRWLAARPRRGMVVLVSDGFGVGLDDAAEALDRIRHAGHDAAMVQVLSPDELEPPPPGEYEMEDVEGGPPVAVIVDAAARREFRERAGQFLAGLESKTAAAGIPFLRTFTSEPPGSALSRALTWA